MFTDEHYKRCKYSVTCATDNLAVVHCLRALCEYAFTDRYPQIGWGGTTERAWRAAGNKITLRFTTPQSRDNFVREATRLLPPGSWRETDRSDNDPAKRQRGRKKIAQDVSPG